MARGDDSDAVYSTEPMAFGILALDLLLKGLHGTLVVLKNARYDAIPLDVVTGLKKVVNVEQFYNSDCYCPKNETFRMKPMFSMTSEV